MINAGDNGLCNHFHMYDIIIWQLVYNDYQLVSGGTHYPNMHLGLTTEMKLKVF